MKAGWEVHDHDFGARNRRCGLNARRLLHIVDEWSCYSRVCVPNSPVDQRVDLSGIAVVFLWAFSHRRDAEASQDWSALPVEEAMARFQEEALKWY